ncbi:luciferase family protein [Streptomyces coeruleoprunus]|uniref:Luciferase family protein n=1 Tax=Streptomyces coeruleoprunus TaxID=285563 RepID=A0ABV9X954_9ACTN
MNLARDARDRLACWPALSRGRACCGTSYCLYSGGAEIVHFHGDDKADVHLTRGMIDRLGPALRRSTALRFSPASGWVTVRLETGSDIDLLATLVSAALTASDGVAGAVSTPGAGPGAAVGAEARSDRSGRAERTGRAGRPTGPSTDPSAGLGPTPTPCSRHVRP